MNDLLRSFTKGKLLKCCRLYLDSLTEAQAARLLDSFQTFPERKKAIKSSMVRRTPAFYSADEPTVLLGLPTRGVQAVNIDDSDNISMSEMFESVSTIGPAIISDPLFGISKDDYSRVSRTKRPETGGPATWIQGEGVEEIQKLMQQISSTSDQKKAKLINQEVSDISSRVGMSMDQQDLLYTIYAPVVLQHTFKGEARSSILFVSTYITLWWTKDNPDLYRLLALTDTGNSVNISSAVSDICAAHKADNTQIGKIVREFCSQDTPFIKQNCGFNFPPVVEEYIQSLHALKDDYRLRNFNTFVYRGACILHALKKFKLKSPTRQQVLDSCLVRSETAAKQILRTFEEMHI